MTQEGAGNRIFADQQSGGFIELEPMRRLPGMTRAVAWTLAKVWDADISLSDLMLSRKLFENVSSLFANESEFVIIEMHLARQLESLKTAC